MHKQMIMAAALAWSAAGVCACNEATVNQAPQDASADVSSLADAATDGAMPDGGDAGTGIGDSGGSEAADTDASVAGIPARMLLSYNGTGLSELVAFGLASNAVDGRLVYPGFIGTTYVTAQDPWLLEQSKDVVARLDRARPWVVQSSWNVAMNDGIDGGDPYADPVAVVVGTGKKAYVLRYTRNDIAILDPAQGADGGAPTGSIDLSGEVQTTGDGIVEMTAGVFVPSKQRVYVLLANINRGNVGCNGYCLLCTSAQPTVVAIDVTTDTLVDLNGSAPGVGLSLNGYQPVFGPGAMAYDVQGDRLLILQAGCNPAGTDGGIGPIVKREVETLSLTSGQSQQLLDLTSATFPQQIVYIDAHHAIVQTDKAYAWDPTTTALGAAIPNAPDTFAWDGAGNLLGVSARYGTDGGLAGWDVLSVRASDGQATKLGADPFSLTNGFVGGVQLWPQP